MIVHHRHGSEMGRVRPAHVRFGSNASVS
jgi:hypothetical protein